MRNKNGPDAMLQKINNPRSARPLMTLPIATILATVALLTIACPVGITQTQEMETFSDVANLLQRLKGDEIDDRDAAEQEMIRLPVNALDFIDIPSDNATTDLIQRLTRIRLALEKRAVEQTLLPSKVTIKGNFSIREILAEIHQQTTNQVKLNRNIADTLGDQKVEINLKDASFWDALNIVMEAGHLEVDPYSGGVGQMGLRSTGDTTPRAVQANTTATLLPPPSDTSGLLSMEVSRVHASRNFRNPALNFTTINLQARWEPRVTPISIELDTSKLKITDDRQQSVELRRKNNIAGVVQAEIPELEFPISVGLISRDIRQLDKITGTFNAILPGRLETFTFRNLGNLADGVQKTKSGATVTWHGYVTNEELFALTIELNFDDVSNGIDSHLGWAYDNEIYLVRDGQRFESVASETLAQQGQRIKVQYLFEEDPETCDLVYKTPAAIVKVALDFELENIVLP